MTSTVNCMSKPTTQHLTYKDLKFAALSLLMFGTYLVSSYEQEHKMNGAAHFVLVSVLCVK